jgi:serine/threonine protein kinase
MNRPYDSLVDIWSIGIIMYILESGGSHPLYNSHLDSKNFINMIKNKKIINFPDFCPSIARNFFLKLCKYEPFFRYNVIKALNHPWIIRTNHKIPLTVFEDFEKENKIKNFKNMMLTLIYLKQLKYLFKRNMKRAKTIN